MNIKLLIQPDWQAWKQIRLEALKNAPTSFGSSYEEELNHSDSEFQDRLNKNDIFGGFLGEELVACAGFTKLSLLKKKHIGIIFSTYIKPEFRGKGIASKLIDAVVDHAKNHVIQVHLNCVTSNIAAINLYQKHGFKIYGTELRSYKIDDKFYDQHLMVLEF